MYSIVALVYVMLAGQAIDTGPITVRHRDSFTSIGACQEMLVSQKFADQKAELIGRMETALMRLYEQADAAAEGIPTPSVAITASCEPDARL